MAGLSCNEGVSKQPEPEFSGSVDGNAPNKTTALESKCACPLALSRLVDLALRSRPL